MKKLICMALAALMIHCGFAQKKVVMIPTPSVGKTTTTHDKQFIQDYFDETYQNIVKVTEGLSDEQLNFKASPDKWSVLECLEHIVITEPMLIGIAKKAMEKPTTPEKRSAVKHSDDEILAMITDRTHKAKASSEITPTGKYKDVASALKDLQAQHDAFFAYLNGYTEDDLRNRVMEGPLGAVDAYQFTLFIAGHAARHTLQMEEVKADPNFPKQ